MDLDQLSMKILSLISTARIDGQICKAQRARQSRLYIYKERERDCEREREEEGKRDSDRETERE
jgi:hypothetical protein